MGRGDSRKNREYRGGNRLAELEKRTIGVGRIPFASAIEVRKLDDDGSSWREPALQTHCFLGGGKDSSTERSESRGDRRYILFRKSLLIAYVYERNEICGHGDLLGIVSDRK
jgi:hypothetical protein